MKLQFEIIDWKILWFGSMRDLKDWLYEIKERKKIRSLDQNKLYWGYILKYIVQEYKDCWYIYTTNYIHKKFKKAFTPRIKVKSDFSKKYIWQSWSTANLTTKQFSEYIQAIKVIMEFWEMDKLELEKISWFIIPDVDEKELLNWIDKII